MKPNQTSSSKNHALIQKSLNPMDLTNSKSKIALVYTSVTGNTEELARILHQLFHEQAADVEMFRIEEFHESTLGMYDAVVVGTYSWGSGEIPKEMWDLFEAFERLGQKKLITAVFGTGDSFFQNYCGAVDRFRDMLYAQTTLTATLKVELMPQEQDTDRCRKFVNIVLQRVLNERPTRL